MRWFKGIGWVGVQHAMADPDNHIQFVMKSSSFGSISHSHGDQNAFCMAAFGEDLAIQSGYYVAFNSTMHQKWRRQTRSKNAILINGKGQYADKDKAKAMAATGKILAAEEREDHIYIRGDATAAYRSLSPEVTLAEREVYFVRNSYFVIVDKVDAETPVTIDWLLHANAPYDLGKTSFRYSGERAGFYGQVVWSEAGKPELTQETGFPGVDPCGIRGPAGQHLPARPVSRGHAAPDRDPAGALQAQRAEADLPLHGRPGLRREPLFHRRRREHLQGRDEEAGQHLIRRDQRRWRTGPERSGRWRLN